MSEFKDIPVRLSPNKLTLSDSELQRIGQLIYRRAGIVVNAQKREMIFNRLSRRLRALGIDTFLEYISILESHSEHPEWQNFVNALTTNLTSFFREPTTSRCSQNTPVSGPTATASGVPPLPPGKNLAPSP